jgi:hypothetical protein
LNAIAPILLAPDGNQSIIQLLMSTETEMNNQENQPMPDPLPTPGLIQPPQPQPGNAALTTREVRSGNYYISGSEIPVNKLTRSQFEREITHTLDEYSDIEYSQDEKDQIAKHLRAISHGAQVMAPMVCAGANCPVSDRCPLQQMNKAPVGRLCLIELNLFQHWRLRS